MKLMTRAFHHDYYNEDLDIPPWIIRPTSRRSKAKGFFKHMAAKARREEWRDARREYFEEIYGE